MRSSIIGAALAAVLGLTAACGDTESAAGGSSTATDSAVEQRHNDADVRFAQRMIPHHEQAVAMAKMVPGRSSDEALRDLAEQIRAAQGPEIRQLKSLLDSWSEPVEPESAHSSDRHESMSGMMSDEQMRQLEQADGSGFGNQWIEMMIDHHRGAVEMANTELDSGVNPAARDLAEDIVAAQKDEIGRMKEMLES